MTMLGFVIAGLAGGFIFRETASEVSNFDCRAHLVASSGIHIVVSHNANVIFPMPNVVGTLIVCIRHNDLCTEMPRVGPALSNDFALRHSRVVPLA